MTTTRRCARLVAVVAVLAAGSVGGNAQAGIVTAVPGAAIAGGIAIPAQAWVDVTDRPSGISAKLPGAATTGTVSRLIGAQQVKGRYYQVDSGGNRVTFLVYDTPGTPESLDRLLQGYGSGMTVTSQMPTASGRPARDARIQHEGEQVFHFVRVIGTKTHVVQLVVTGPVANENVGTQQYQQLRAGLSIP